MKLLLYSVLTLMLFSSCKKEKEYMPPNFNYEIPDVPVTENINVGAFYYNYNTAEWAKKYSYTPALGEYNSLTASVMAQQRALADQAAVDFFIFNWNGASSGNPLLNNFVNGRTEKVKMVINYNTAHLGATNASPLTGAKLNNMINELKTLATDYFSKDYYFKIDGKPVILITPLNLSTSAASSINYTTVVPAVKDSLKQIGVEVYIIGEITTGWLPPGRYAAASKVMNGVTATNWATDVYDRSVFFNSFSDMNWKNWTDSTTSWNVDFTPCIFPGFNDKKFAPTSKMFDVGRTAEFYVDYCNVAKRNMSAKKIVLVNSWNNFQLGTALEPAAEYGNTYLEITKAQFKVK